MVSKTFSGEIKGKIIELRFSFAGKLSSLYKKKGDGVRKGNLIASLDKKSLQAELDKQLGDFEKVRAEFEIYNLQKGEPKDDVAKYLKSEKQSQLNISVKEVELAKMKLDQADLFSPIEGVIIDDSSLVAGIYITPSSNPIKVLDVSSYFFEFQIEQKDLPNFSSPKPAKIDFVGIKKTFSGISNPIIPQENGKFKVEVKLETSEGLILGIIGKAKF